MAYLRAVLRHRPLLAGCLSSKSGKADLALHRHGQVLRAHPASFVRRVLSVRSDGPSLAPFVEIGASPRHRTRPEAHRARELVLRNQPVDGRPPESGHAHDGGHPQEERRHHLSAAERWYGRVALHGLSPVRGISATLGCWRDVRRAGFGPKSCVVVHPDTS